MRKYVIMAYLIDVLRQIFRKKFQIWLVFFNL